MPADLTDLRKGKLSPADHPRRSQTVPEQKGAVIDIICLRTDMNIDLRTDALCNIKQTRV